MPILEVVAMIGSMLIFFLTIAGMTRMFLSHRREMARIKAGSAQGQLASDTASLENAELKETVSLMQDRIAVLEQIATDPAVRTAREIEDLRNEREAKSPVA